MGYTRGRGPTHNKFTKTLEDSSTVSIVVGDAPDQWSVKDLIEILKFFDKPADKEVIDVTTPDAKRRSGRSRKAGRDSDKAGEVYQGRSK